MQPLPDTGSVTAWLARLKTGDEVAASELWARYSARMMALARSRVGRQHRPAADEEDVALSAFGSFCRRAGTGQFADLADRDGLWRLLFTLTSRKAVSVVRHETRQKRRGGDRVALDDLPTAALAPDEAALLDDECRRLFDRLPGPDLKGIAVARLEGYSVAEIAARLGCTTRTVERKLRVIRRLWDEGEG